MFGHDDEQPSTDNGTTQVTEPKVAEPAADGSLSSDNTTSVTSIGTDDVPSAPAVVQPDEPPATVNEPTVDDMAQPEKQEDTEPVIEPPETPSSDTSPQDSDSSGGDDHPSETPQLDLPAPSISGAPDLPTTSSADTTAKPDDLLSIKQEALQQLSPLVSHLDQTPEEKFHTTMMMIQASDDQSLIQTAFEAAKDITDDKARAQALLDIINEINYFTQHQSADPVT